MATIRSDRPAIKPRRVLRRDFFLQRCRCAIKHWPSILLGAVSVVASCERMPQRSPGRTEQIPANPGFSVVGAGASEAAHGQTIDQPPRRGTRRVEKSTAAWGNELPDLVFRVTRLGETEPRFTGGMYAQMAQGGYHCACCDALLFSSDDKFVSGSGWPAFTQPVNPDVVWSRQDPSAFQSRVAILCSVCDAILGHRFDDGPPPSGQRFSINATALRFAPQAGHGQQPHGQPVH